MERCATCKHWMEGHFYPGYKDDWKGWGVCALTIVHDGEGAARGPNDDHVAHPDSKAFAFDKYDSYGGELRTHETFGCVQHEPISPGKR